MSKLFRIEEEDLVELEKLLPIFADWLMNTMADLDAKSETDPSCKTAVTTLRMRLRRTKDIISDVRWGYGPPLVVGIIPCGDGSAPADDQAA